MSYTDESDIDSDIEGLLYSQLHYSTDINIDESSELIIDKDEIDNETLDLHSKEVADKETESGSPLPIPKQAINDLWKIHEKDLQGAEEYNKSFSDSNRYYIDKQHRGVLCYNCKTRGHLSRDCPQPLKEEICYLCGLRGHSRNYCPNDVCYNCYEIGHISKTCVQPKRNYYSVCKRCWGRGHNKNTCPEMWRQYHLTVKEDGRIIKPKMQRNGVLSNIRKVRFCYNCGNKGHFGHDCHASRQTRRSVNSPFVVYYDKCPYKSKTLTTDAKNDSFGSREEKSKQSRKRKIIDNVDSPVAEGGVDPMDNVDSPSVIQDEAEREMMKGKRQRTSVEASEKTRSDKGELEGDVSSEETSKKETVVEKRKIKRNVIVNSEFVSTDSSYNGKSSKERARIIDLSRTATSSAAVISSDKEDKEAYPTKNEYTYKQQHATIDTTKKQEKSCFVRSSNDRVDEAAVVKISSDSEEIDALPLKKRYTYRQQHLDTDTKKTPKEINHLPSSNGEMNEASVLKISSDSEERETLPRRSKYTYRQQQAVPSVNKMAENNQPSSNSTKGRNSNIECGDGITAFGSKVAKKVSLESCKDISGEKSDMKNEHEKQSTKSIYTTKVNPSFPKYEISSDETLEVCTNQEPIHRRSWRAQPEEKRAQKSNALKKRPINRNSFKSPSGRENERKHEKADTLVISDDEGSMKTEANFDNLLDDYIDLDVYDSFSDEDFNVEKTPKDAKKEETRAASIIFDGNSSQKQTDDDADEKCRQKGRSLGKDDSKKNRTNDHVERSYHPEHPRQDRPKDNSKLQDRVEGSHRFKERGCLKQDHNKHGNHMKIEGHIDHKDVTNDITHSKRSSNPRYEEHGKKDHVNHIKHAADNNDDHISLDSVEHRERRAQGKHMDRVKCQDRGEVKDRVNSVQKRAHDKRQSHADSQGRVKDRVKDSAYSVDGMQPLDSRNSMSRKIETLREANLAVVEARENVESGMRRSRQEKSTTHSYIIDVEDRTKRKSNDIVERSLKITPSTNVDARGGFQKRNIETKSGSIDQYKIPDSNNHQDSPWSPQFIPLSMGRTVRNEDESTTDEDNLQFSNLLLHQDYEVSSEDDDLRNTINTMKSNKRRIKSQKILVKDSSRSSDSTDTQTSCKVYAEDNCQVLLSDANTTLDQRMVDLTRYNPSEIPEGHLSFYGLDGTTDQVKKVDERFKKPQHVVFVENDDSDINSETKASFLPPKVMSKFKLKRLQNASGQKEVTENLRYVKTANSEAGMAKETIIPYSHGNDRDQGNNDSYANDGYSKESNQGNSTFSTNVSVLNGGNQGNMNVEKMMSELLPQLNIHNADLTKLSNTWRKQAEKFMGALKYKRNRRAKQKVKREWKNWMCENADVMFDNSDGKSNGLGHKDSQNSANRGISNRNFVESRKVITNAEENINQTFRARPTGYNRNRNHKKFQSRGGSVASFASSPGPQRRVKIFKQNNREQPSKNRGFKFSNGSKQFFDDIYL